MRAAPDSACVRTRRVWGKQARYGSRWSIVLLRQRPQLLGPEALSGFQDMGELVELLFDSTELLRGQCDAITQAYAASVGNRMAAI